MGINLIFDDSTTVHFIKTLFQVFNIWSWILALFGYASSYLNHHSRFLTYCNEAVYPFYILHQTIMIVIGFYLMDLNWGFWTKAMLMVAGTFGGSFVLYEFIIRRLVFIRQLFGLKIVKRQQQG